MTGKLCTSYRGRPLQKLGRDDHVREAVSVHVARLAHTGLATTLLRASALAELLNRAARGLPMPNRIDPCRGY